MKRALGLSEMQTKNLNLDYIRKTDFYISKQHKPQNLDLFLNSEQKHTLFMQHMINPLNLLLSQLNMSSIVFNLFILFECSVVFSSLSKHVNF